MFEPQISWGPQIRISWGHAVSSNLIKWKIYPKVLHPAVDPNPTFFRGKEVRTVSKLREYAEEIHNNIYQYLNYYFIFSF